MMCLRLPLTALAILAGLIGQSALASTRLPDYGVTEIGNPGSGRYVFCTDATCPEPTIKHIAAPAAVVPPSLPITATPSFESHPLPAPTAHTVKPRHSHRARGRHARHVRAATSSVQCMGASDGAIKGKPLARR
ncbi:hypothetical protein [Burkholderia gladioli]|uniref:hypothetical protein n=1 Tax=Burkholderia gladioli TaxID=28095 RepID=UPI000D00C0A2|nr:hypothetical protein [Burkholderia gladioli]MDN7466280.1 hypothetical protein [Burkholderia gladioli]MDN7812872.1 hypothetical protein [Burkholderia gladioli]PRE10719.1 hypothetical protein C6P72_34335 [Burkholderia gladioli]